MIFPIFNAQPELDKEIDKIVKPQPLAFRLNLLVMRLLWKVIRGRYYTKIGRPIRCTGCGSVKIKDVEKGRIEGLSCEIENECEECGAVIGFWAYGYYDPKYRNNLST